MSAPTPLRVRLPFRSEDEFAAHYGAHVGRDGFFLATRAPKPVGAELLFELVLTDGTPLLRGEGVVVRSSSSGDRPGMTLRFLRLEEAGKALVERIVSSRPARGSAPAEAQAHPSAWAAPAGPSATATPAGREATPRPAHPEAWAPPAGPALAVPRPTGPQPPAVAPLVPSPASATASDLEEVGDEAEPLPDASAEAMPAEPEPAEEAADGPLESTSLEAWAARREAAGAPAAPPEEGSVEAPEPIAAASAGASPPATTQASAPSPAAEPPEPSPTPGAPPAASPPLDDSELPELVVTEFKGPGRRRPTGLAHTPASADVHAAITPPAGTLVVTELDEPPPEPAPRFRLDAPVRGDEPLHVPESSFHDVAEALGKPGSVHERPTSPIPLLPSMETAAPDEFPVPPPPPLDVAPVPEEGAVRIEPGTEAPPAPVAAEALVTPAPVAPPAAPAPPPPAEPPPARAATAPPPPVPEKTPTPAPGVAAARTSELGIEINPESIRVAWFHDGKAEPLLLDQARGQAEVTVRLVREPGAPPRMLPPEAPDVPLWVGAPLPFLGTRADSDTARTVARRWPATLVPDDRGESAFALEGGTVGATELVAALLRWVRQRAEQLTSHPPGRVVLTVPVSFTTLQRERLREAAERAGFEGVRLVQMPTAATMAFAHGRGLARRRILVFRMGASTCDVAVLAASGDDLDMVACAGDASLGSVNFDEQIALALDKGVRADATVLRRRISEAGLLRAQLEDHGRSEASVEGGARLSRSELEIRTTTLAERGVLLARDVLRSASLTPEALDELVLVGAVTRLPHVRRMIEEAMGRTARTDVDAGAAVSLGAATLARLLDTAGPKSASRTSLHEVLGVPLEIVAPELGQVRVLDRNTRLPAEKTLTVTLGLGAPLEVQVFQGPAKAPDPRSFLGLLRAPADRAGDWALHLSLDTDGVLRAAATNPSGKRQALQLQMPAPTPETETPPPQRAPTEPETPAMPPKPDTGVLGGLKKLFGRR